MDIQLSELIEKIKNDGVRSAENKAAQIIAEAEEKAASILQKAGEDAKRIKSIARADADRVQMAGIEAIRQAGRDLTLSVKSEIESLFQKVIEAEVASEMDSNTISKAILTAVENLSTDAVDIQLPTADFEAMEQRLRSLLKEKFASGIEIVPLKGLRSGFRIGKKDGSAFYDFSGREVAEMLSHFLNPGLARLLTE